MASNQVSQIRTRRRSELAVAVVLVIFAGLASRAFLFLLPSALEKYPGDALWATMVLFSIALLRPELAPLKVAGLALIVSYAVEFSQIYQGVWANAIRATRVGHLVFGAGFDWFDLAAYALGVLAGSLLDARFFFRFDRT